MNRYRLRDVAKGQRWSHFWTYYGFTVVAAAVILALAGYTGYLIFGKPAVDVQIVILSDQFDLREEEAIRSQWESLPLDINGDGVTRIVLSYIHFDKPYEELAADTRQELLTMLSVGDTMVFLANEPGGRWLEELSLVAVCSQGDEEGEVFRLAVAQVPMLGDFRSMDGLTLYLAASGKDPSAYQVGRDALLQILKPYLT